MEPSAHGRRAITRRRLGWTLAAIIGAALLATALWVSIAVLPSRLYPSLNSRDLVGLTPGERAERIEGQRKLQNDARTTALQGLAALLVLVGAGIGAAVTLRQVRTSREQLEVTRQQMQAEAKQAREQLAVAEQGQITERFTRAIDQLGSPTIDVRLGGIYALERIARDSPDDRPTISEVLTAFIRSHAPWPPSTAGQYRITAPIDQVPELQVRAADVQASLTVLGRRGFSSPEREGDPRLDLTAVDLRCANLFDAHLDGASLRDAHLERAVLLDAHLKNAVLHGAYLERAALYGTHLEGAVLIHAHLKLASLRGAYLERAVLYGADLEGANLYGTHLNGANLRDAHLERAVLLDAHLEGADLRGADLGDAHLEDVDLGDAHLEGAKADESTSWPARFDWRAAGVIVTARTTQQLRFSK